MIKACVYMLQERKVTRRKVTLNIYILLYFENIVKMVAYYTATNSAMHTPTQVVHIYKNESIEPR